MPNVPTDTKTHQEIVDLVADWYETKLRILVETPENMGKMILVDAISGDYEISGTGDQYALEILRSRQPNGLIGGRLIGHDYSEKPAEPRDELCFDYSDAWLLLSIIYAGKEATLTRIIGSGDMLNHAIFNEEELIGGFARLIAGEFVREDHGTFAADSRSHLAKHEIAQIEPYTIPQTPLLAKWLCEKPAVSKSKYETNRVKYAAFVADNFVAAYKEYTGWHKSVLDKIAPALSKAVHENDAP